MSALHGSLFTGAAGLDRAVEAVLGTRPAFHAESDADASRVLAHHYPDVPNLGDVTLIDWTDWAGLIFLLCGGFPCQDVSVAGARAGLAGARSGLWVEFRRAIAELRPPLVFIENVRGLASACAVSDLEPCPRCMGGTSPHRPVLRALGRVLGDLADLGYDAAWHGMAASDVGAPHERFRIFILAWPAADSSDERHERRGDTRERRHGLAHSDVAAAHAADRGHAVGVALRTCDETVRTCELSSPKVSAAVWVQPVAELGIGGTPVAGHARAAVADTDNDAAGNGCECGDETGRGAESAQHRRTAADAVSSRRNGWASDTVGQPIERAATSGSGDRSFAAWGPYAPAIERWERLTHPAPAPTVPGQLTQHRLREWAFRECVDGYAAHAMLKSGRWGARLNPALPEWMMGWPDGWVTRVPGLSRNAQLRIVGNGVVTAQAEAALRFLLDVRAGALAEAVSA